MFESATTNIHVTMPPQQRRTNKVQTCLFVSYDTVAAINGHFCAAGAMLGLAFDMRVMRTDKGMFFVPAVDLGLGMYVELAL
jgi:enoyl-CoA hydratase/carnithine racemase